MDIIEYMRLPSFIPACGASSPGYNDLGVRTTGEEETQPVIWWMQRVNNNLLMVNSLNEWHEGTPMEPASGWRIHDKARGSARLWIRVPRIR
jgi:hypothetical protein